MNNLQFLKLPKPEGTIVFYFLFMDRQGHNPTLRHNLQTKHLHLVSLPDKRIGPFSDLLSIQNVLLGVREIVCSKKCIIFFRNVVKEK